MIPFCWLQFLYYFFCYSAFQVYHIQRSHNTWRLYPSIRCKYDYFVFYKGIWSSHLEYVPLYACHLIGIVINSDWSSFLLVYVVSFFKGTLHISGQLSTFTSFFSFCSCFSHLTAIQLFCERLAHESQKTYATIQNVAWDIVDIILINVQNRPCCEPHHEDLQWLAIWMKQFLGYSVDEVSSAVLKRVNTGELKAEISLTMCHASLSELSVSKESIL